MEKLCRYRGRKDKRDRRATHHKLKNAQECLMAYVCNCIAADKVLHAPAGPGVILFAILMHITLTLKHTKKSKQMRASIH